MRSRLLVCSSQVRHEFTPTPSMLDLQKQIQYLLQSREYDRAEVVRRDLVNQEHKERKQWAEELWRSWGCRVRTCDPQTWATVTWASTAIRLPRQTI